MASEQILSWAILAPRNVLAPQQTTACEITFMLGEISPTADQGTNIKGEFCLLQPHSYVSRYKEMTEGREVSMRVRTR